MTAIVLLTVPEVADRLRVSRRTVERLLRRRDGRARLRHVKIGARTFVKESELDAFLAHLDGQRSA